MNCIICGKELTEKQAYTFMIGKKKNPQKTGPYCSQSCCCKDPVIQAKKRKACLQKYGCENPSQCEAIKRKKEETTLKHFGVKYPTQSAAVKAKVQASCLQHYKCKNPSQSDVVKAKKIATCLQHFGTEYSLQSAIVREKGKQTLLQKYGVQYATQAPSIKKKCRQSVLSHFGVQHPLQSEIIKARVKNTCLTVYGVDNPRKRLEIKQRSFSTLKTKNPSCQLLFSVSDWKGTHNVAYYPIKCRHCGQVYTAKINCFTIAACPVCTANTSLKQRQVASFVQSISNKPIVVSQRSILNGCGDKGGNLQIDIYVPQLKIGFQFNGNYWHKEGHMKQIGYHKKKTLLCKQRGINLYHIWQYQWDNNKQLVKCAIKNILERRY